MATPRKLAPGARDRRWRWKLILISRDDGHNIHLSHTQRRRELVCSSFDGRGSAQRSADGRGAAAAVAAAEGAPKQGGSWVQAVAERCSRCLPVAPPYAHRRKGVSEASAGGSHVSDGGHRHRLHPRPPCCLHHPHHLPWTIGERRKLGVTDTHL